MNLFFLFLPVALVAAAYFGEEIEPSPVPDRCA
jgi:hypothetical protein